MRSGCDGGLAIEKGRVPSTPGMVTLTYWPAWKAMPAPDTVELDANDDRGVRRVRRSTMPTWSPTGRRSASGSSSTSASMTSAERGTARAGERLAFQALAVHQREGRCGAVIDLALEHVDLAGAAQAVAAGMGQPDAGAQAGFENGLAILNRHQLRRAALW